MSETHGDAETSREGEVRYEGGEHQSGGAGMPVAAPRLDASEATLLARLVARDATALEDAYSRYAHTVLAYVRSLIGQSDHEEEILQDTFLALWRGAAGIEGRSRLSTWLIGVARRQALTRLRGPQRRTLGLDEAEHVPAAGPSLEDAVLASVAVEETARLVRRLSPLQREVLVLVFVHELSYQEMAELLDVPLGTVKSRLSAARCSLARLIREGSAAASQENGGAGWL